MRTTAQLAANPKQPQTDSAVLLQVIVVAYNRDQIHQLFVQKLTNRRPQRFPTGETITL